MYNVKFPLFLFCLFFSWRNQFHHLWKLFSVNKESHSLV